MSCDTELLLDHLAGRLDGPRTAILQKHIQKCYECAAVAGGQNGIWQVLDEFAAPAVGTNFNRGVWQKIEAAAREPWYAAVVRSLREGAWQPVLPVAATVVLIAAGFAFDHKSHPAAAATVTVAEAELAQNTLEDLRLLQNLNMSAAEVAEPIL